MLTPFSPFKFTFEFQVFVIQTEFNFVQKHPVYISDLSNLFCFDQFLSTDFQFLVSV